MLLSSHQRLVRAAASMIVGACLGLIVAAQSGFGSDPDRGLFGRRTGGKAVMDETTGSIGPSGARRVEPALSDEDCFRIYEGVMRIPDAPQANAPAPDVADMLADEVAMQDLPLSVVRRLPQVVGMKFVKFDDRIVVVNPQSRIVVAMIPRYKLMP